MCQTDSWNAIAREPFTQPERHWTDAEVEEPLRVDAKHDNDSANAARGLARMANDTTQPAHTLPRQMGKRGDMTRYSVGLTRAGAKVSQNLFSYTGDKPAVGDIIDAVQNLYPASGADPGRAPVRARVGSVDDTANPQIVADEDI